jgi:predicted nucleotidyltransferase
MRIQSDALVAGFPAKKTRELLRQSDEFLSVRDATRILGINGRKAIRLLECLEHEGFIEKNAAVPNSETEQFWRPTIKGSALRAALFSTPVSRRTAEKKLSEFMNRVHQVNMDSRFLYKVRKVVVFGSYLSDAPSVGDLDLAVDLGPKEPDSKKHAEMVLARANEAARNGRCFHNFVERIGFADQEVRSFLKARSRIIQLTDCDDGILKIAESRVIYVHHEKNVPCR